MTAQPAGAWPRAPLAGDDRPTGTQSIRRALLILRVLATAGHAGLAMTDLARATGLARPTAHRVLRALLAEGLVEQRPRTRRYATAAHVELAAGPRPSRSPWVSAAAAHLDEAADKLGDTIFLTLRMGRETICVDRRLGSYPIQVPAIAIGSRRPLGVSSAGIAMLATLRPAAASRLLVQVRPQLKHYQMSLDDSLAAVAEARAVGYALRERGLVAGTKALSIAFARGNHHARAALTIAGISRRMQPQRLSSLVEHLQHYADRIETSFNELDQS